MMKDTWINDLSYDYQCACEHWEARPSAEHVWAVLPLIGRLLRLDPVLISTHTNFTYESVKEYEHTHAATFYSNLLYFNELTWITNCGDMDINNKNSVWEHLRLLDDAILIACLYKRHTGKHAYNTTGAIAYAAARADMFQAVGKRVSATLAARWNKLPAQAMDLALSHGFLLHIEHAHTLVGLSTEVPDDATQAQTQTPELLMRPFLLPPLHKELVDNALAAAPLFTEDSEDPLSSSHTHMCIKKELSLIAGDGTWHGTLFFPSHWQHHDCIMIQLDDSNDQPLDGTLALCGFRIELTAGCARIPLADIITYWNTGTETFISITTAEGRVHLGHIAP